MAGFKAAWLDPLALTLMPLPLAFTTAGDAANGLLFGWEIDCEGRCEKEGFDSNC